MEANPSKTIKMDSLKIENDVMKDLDPFFLMTFLSLINCLMSNYLRINYS